ncbi:MAG TPA: HAD hydrolase family protein [Phycisphaerales bacterium]|nr:HAD hydrolase family protein [Phycisphaerales bacterium]
MSAFAEVVISAEMSARLRDVALLVFDFDGVWTTNQVLVMQDGSEGVLANRSDGLGIGMLRASGLEMMVLSAEVNPVVSARCAKVKMPCVQGEADKAGALRRILAEKKIDAARVAYVGNDVNDVPCMNMVGVPIAVADSWPTVLPHAKLVTRRIGGHGAVREVCEWFLAARQSKAAADGRNT